MTTPTTTEPRSSVAGDDEAPELRKVTLTMPTWMLEDLRRRARQRGITVTELIRRSVSLERMLFENPDNEVVLREPDGKESILRLL